MIHMQFSPGRFTREEYAHESFEHICTLPAHRHARSKTKTPTHAKIYLRVNFVHVTHNTDTNKRTTSTHSHKHTISLDDQLPEAHACVQPIRHVQIAKAQIEAERQLISPNTKYAWTSPRVQHLDRATSHSKEVIIEFYLTLRHSSLCRVPRSWRGE